MADVSALLSNLIYPPPPSVFITAMSVVGFVSLANAGWNETKGKHMQYSKLKSPKQKQLKAENKQATPPEKVEEEEKAQVGGKLGMIVLYTPAFIAGASSFFLYPHGDLRFALLQSAVTVHFLKRILEVLFVHKFSGFMDVEAMAIISTSYFTFSALAIYNQSLTIDLPEPSFDLKFVGVALFILGIVGNFYHHYLLSRLRSEGEEQYKIPQGGLFGLVVCPHYFFEILGFYGMSCISQTLYPLCFTLGTTFYLMGRSYATREWYKSKFEEFDEDVKAVIPYLF